MRVNSPEIKQFCEIKLNTTNKNKSFLKASSGDKNYQPLLKYKSVIPKGEMINVKTKTRLRRRQYNNDYSYMWMQFL